MVVNTHTAKSCAFRSEDEAQHLEAVTPYTESVLGAGAPS
jgi:hypothetical protein